MQLLKWQALSLANHTLLCEGCGLRD